MISAPLSDKEDHSVSENSKLEELHVENRQTKVGHSYTRFVKLMRYILPFAAIALIVVIITWSNMDEKITIVQKTELIPESENDIGENELLNPKFETTDAQSRPVNITANRALQNQENPNLVKLDKPFADLQMKNGSAVHIEALNGTYEQEAEKLFLQDNVKIKHESGYELQAEEMRVDMKTREAFSDKDVSIVGPDANIQAKGLEGNMDEGVLTFKGPATLTFKNTQKNSAENQKDLSDE